MTPDLIHAELVLRAVEDLLPELLDFAKALIAIPTVNPPGDNYLPCAELLAARLCESQFETAILAAEGHPDHSPRHPRYNVLATRAGQAKHPALHFNGHVDVVPPGAHWTRDPFRATVEKGRLYGRGSSDMKAGLAAAIFAAEALRRAGITLRGTLQISATVDEESGGFAGVAHLAEQGLLTSRSIDYVIIPEPFGASRICVGHRGVYWFRIISHGKTAHGSMPYLGINAIENMAALLEEIRATVAPEIAARLTAMPVTPGQSKCGTLNINSIVGGQSNAEPQSPCVADHCEVVCERRWVPEESLADVKAQIAEAIGRVIRAKPGAHFTLEDYGNTVHPSRTPDDAPLVAALSDSIGAALSRAPDLVASPGTYDHKHFALIGNIAQCVAYGPGILEQAHQPDEYCLVEDILHSCQVMALTAANLLG